MSILGFRSGAGLRPEFPSPPDDPSIDEVVTEESAVQTPIGRSLRVTPLVKEGDDVAKGAAVACLRHAPDVCFVAPVAGRIARISLLPGRRLSEIVVFRDEAGGVERHDTAGASTAAGLRRLMQASGFWPWLRRRPFGGMPAHGETPEAIVVMAVDTRPFAPDPALALEGREEDFARGIAALARVTDGPVLVFAADGSSVTAMHGDRVQMLACGPRHPQGSAGIRIHQTFPAAIDAPVWDVHAEDVAALGGLLDTGELPMMRRVHIAGDALRQAATVRTHPGADLRQLTQRIVERGPYELLTGSPLDGRAAHWLAPRHRQITVLPRQPDRGRPHWLISALTRSAAARPAIPTAALTQAFGAALPAVPFVRALGAGDDDTAMRFGVLSLLEDDVALADYVLGEAGQMKAQLRAMLDRIEREFAA